MTGELEPLDGVVKRHNHLRIGVYHQHLTEKLTPHESPLEYMMRLFQVSTLSAAAGTSCCALRGPLRALLSCSAMKLPWLYAALCFLVCAVCCCMALVRALESLLIVLQVQVSDPTKMRPVIGRFGITGPGTRQCR